MALMTKLLKEAIERLRQLPEEMQDSAARAVMSRLEEEPEPGDLEAIEQGWKEFERGEFVTLEEWRNEMGLGDRQPGQAAAPSDAGYGPRAY